MAAITSAATGLWSAGATWVGTVTTCANPLGQYDR
jgi:hypothetical protein